MKSSNWLILFRTLVLLTSGTLVVSCSQGPPEPAPEFTLPLSQVTTARPSQEKAAATGSAPSQLRYVAVPPGQNVAGMARARIVLKHKATRHRHPHKKAVGRATAIKKPTENAEPAAKP